MSGGGGDTTVKEKANPWGPSQEYLKYGFSEAKDLYDSGGAQYYPGQTFTGPTGLEQLSQAQMLGFAQNQMPGLYGQMADATTSMLNAPNVANNPYVGAMADTITGRLTENLTENILPSVGRGAVAAGQYGGSRQGIMEGKAIEGTQEAAGDAMAQLYSDAYAQGLKSQALGVGAMPSVMSAGLAPAQTMGGVGQWIRSQNDMALQDDMNRWNYNQNLPQTNLNNYIAAIGGVPLGWGSSTSQSGGGSALGSALGGGLLGYSTLGPAIQGAAFNAIGPGTAASSPLWALSGPMGMGLGVLGGAALPFLLN